MQASDGRTGRAVLRGVWRTACGVRADGTGPRCHRRTADGGERAGGRPAGRPGGLLRVRRRAPLREGSGFGRLDFLYTSHDKWCEDAQRLQAHLPGVTGVGGGLVSEGSRHGGEPSLRRLGVDTARPTPVVGERGSGLVPRRRPQRSVRCGGTSGSVLRSTVMVPRSVVNGRCVRFTDCSSLVEQLTTGSARNAGETKGR